MLNKHRRVSVDAEEKNLAKFRAAGIETVTVAVATSNTLGIIKIGETGYYKTDWPVKDYKQAQEMAAERNRRAGITPAQAAAAEIGSMMGWDVPGADPDAHEEKGA